MTPSPVLRDRLADVKERKRAAQARVKRAQESHEKFMQRVDSSGGQLDLTTPEGKLVRDSGAERAAAREALDLIKEEEHFYLHQMAGIDSPLGSDTFMSDPNVMQELTHLATSSAPIGPYRNLGTAVTRDDMLMRMQRGGRSAAAMPDILDYPGGAGRTQPFAGVVPVLYRQLRLLDIIPSAAMEQKIVPYVQQIPADSTALETPELSMKPEAGVELVDAETRASTIAHWIKLARQTLADFAGLNQAINTQLVFGVNDRLEQQIVNGDGQGDNIRGILNTTGIGSVAYNADEIAADQSLYGITNVMLSNAIPNGVLLNPLDWQAMLKAKSSGSGEYMSMGPFLATAQMLWNTPLIPSVSIQPGKALVGDWQRGATLYIREGVNCRLSDSDQDDFTRNRITILGEGRFGLAVWNPTCFCEVDLTS